MKLTLVMRLFQLFQLRLILPFFINLFIKLTLSIQVFSNDLVSIKEILESFLFCMYLGSFTLPLSKISTAKWQNIAGSKKFFSQYRFNCLLSKKWSSEFCQIDSNFLFCTIFFSSIVALWTVNDVTGKDSMEGPRGVFTAIWGMFHLKRSRPHKL